MLGRCTETLKHVPSTRRSRRTSPSCTSYLGTSGWPELLSDDVGRGSAAKTILALSVVPESIPHQRLFLMTA